MACTRPAPTRSVDHLADPVVDGVHQLDPVGQTGCGQPALGDPQRLRVAVDTDDPQFRVGGEQREGVPAHARAWRRPARHRCAPDRVAASMAGASSSSTLRTRTGTWPSGGGGRPSAPGTVPASTPPSRAVSVLAVWVAGAVRAVVGRCGACAVWRGACRSGS